MTALTDQLDYEDAIVNLMIRVNPHTSRPITLDLWKYYPTETQLMLTSLTQTQHTKKIPKLEGG